MKSCSKCKIVKNINEFNFKSKKNEVRQAQCKKCTRLLIKNHYNKNKDYYLLKARSRNKILRDDVNSFLIEHLSKNACVDCGESDIIVLEFDYTGIKPKFKSVSQLVRSRVHLDVIKEEIKKCEVRCANCHKRKTAQTFNWFKLKKITRS